MRAPHGPPWHHVRPMRRETYQLIIDDHRYSNHQAFLLQISTLIISPAFLAAGWYVLLGKLIAVLGPEFVSVPGYIWRRCQRPRPLQLGPV